MLSGLGDGVCGVRYLGIYSCKRAPATLHLQLSGLSCDVRELARTTFFFAAGSLREYSCTAEVRTQSDTFITYALPSPPPGRSSSAP
eukprot:1451214-Prymnesium_polylepis.1